MKREKEGFVSRAGELEDGSENSAPGSALDCADDSPIHRPDKEEVPLEGWEGDSSLGKLPRQYPYKGAGDYDSGYGACEYPQTGLVTRAAEGHPLRAADDEADDGAKYGCDIEGAYEGGIVG